MSHVSEGFFWQVASSQKTTLNKYNSWVSTLLSPTAGAAITQVHYTVHSMEYVV
jgi:hypothetical protein